MNQVYLVIEHTRRVGDLYTAYTDFERAREEAYALFLPILQQYGTALPQPLPDDFSDLEELFHEHVGGIIAINEDWVEVETCQLIGADA